MKFTEFSLNENLLQGIGGANYVECTPVQEQVLKSSLEGKDLYVQSQTGTGKTAAYLVSVIQELLSRTESRGKNALILVPTRELAVQVEEEAEKLIKFTDLTCSSFFGGVGYDKQIARLKKGCDILIGTPGRVIDLNQGNQMDLKNVGFLVIDEADRMFDMGFYPDLRTLIKVLPSSEIRQTMLFSATLNSYVKNLAWEYTRNPEEITIAAENITVDEINQELFHVSSGDKMKLLLGIIQKERPESLIIFCNTKKSCEIVSKRMKINGIESEFIIGDLPQKKRLAIMEKFKDGKARCLVATDVAARGIDVNDLAMVINYDLPNEAENYVHRIGRTARAGKSGKAYTFCSEQDVYSLPAIERYIEKNIPSQVADESIFVQDKSEGIFIKLDDYHGEYNDKSEFGRKREAEFRGRNRAKKGSGRYSSRNENAKKEYRRDRRVYNPTDEDLLSTMTTEERMKIYREKYGNLQAQKKRQDPREEFSSEKKNFQQKNRKKSAGKNYASGAKNSAVKNNAKKSERKFRGEKKDDAKIQPKKSIASKIKSFFSKKK